MQVIAHKCDLSSFLYKMTNILFVFHTTIVTHSELLVQTAVPTAGAAGEAGVLG